MQRCQNHEAEAQTELWYRCHAPILHAIRRWLARLRSPAELADDISATFWSDLLYDKPWRLRAYQPQRGPVRAYLTGIARLAVLDFLAVERRQTLLTLSLSDLDRVALPVGETEVQEELEHLLARLSERDRALLLSYRDPVPPEPSGGAEATPTAGRLRQRKKRLIHKIFQVLKLWQKLKKPGKNGRAGVTNRPRNLG